MSYFGFHFESDQNVFIVQFKLVHLKTEIKNENDIFKGLVKLKQFVIYCYQLGMFSQVQTISVEYNL